MGSHDFEVSSAVKAAWTLPAASSDEVLPNQAPNKEILSRVKR
jgi:hypothetical protein